MSQGDPIQLAAAEHISQTWLAEYQRLCAPDARIHICGSIRRKEQMVRDIDILVIDPKMHGTLSNATFDGVPLNIYFVKPECEGAGLLFLTGSADFNIQLRRKAKAKGLKLNRYGLWRKDQLLAAATEEDIFKALGMDYVPPEERKSPDGKQKGIKVLSSKVGDAYDVFIKDVHGFNFCTCRGFQYRRDCRHLAAAAEKV